MTARALFTVVVLLGVSSPAAARRHRRRPVTLAAPERSASSRDRDRLLLFRGTQPQGSSIAIGVGMFAAATLGSAHAPRFLRVVFDGPVHLGPAIFDGGGMGAGVAGRGL